jgi:glucuronokinase
LRGVAFARAGLLGNPSDGYEGKVLGCLVRNFAARVSIDPCDHLRITAGGRTAQLPNLGAALEAPFPDSVDGLERLVLAAVVRLSRSLDATRPPPASFHVRCDTTVPRQVGLAGSSAVIIATLRALGAWWSCTPPRFELAEMALATEVEDLGIAAGPLDRVIQSYERTMVMDFVPPRSESAYRTLDARRIPPLIVAWDSRGGESSHRTHSDLGARWKRREPDVVSTMQALRDLVDPGVAALEHGDVDAFADLVDDNFRLRCTITSVGKADRRMVSVARAAGAAAKLCGSGGAVVAVPRTGVRPSAVEHALRAAGFPTCRPILE